MVAERDGNLRRGHRAEQLGILLLQGLAAVAPVPPTEDTGVDVVATLLRPEGARRLIAEDSFYVQVKAASIEEVEYRDGAINWLRMLELPFLIASANLRAGTLHLFALHEINRLTADWSALGDFERLRLFLAVGGPTGNDEPGERRLHIGPPILSFGVTDLSEQAFVERAYSILKQHLNIMRTNRISAQAGFYQEVEWQTNELPKRTLPSQSCGSRGGLHQLLDENWHLIHSWYFQLRALGHPIEAEQLYQLLVRMSQLGWTIPDAASLLHNFKKFDDAFPNRDWFGGGEVQIKEVGWSKKSQDNHDADEVVA